MYAFLLTTSLNGTLHVNSRFTFSLQLNVGQIVLRTRASISKPPWNIEGIQIPSVRTVGKIHPSTYRNSSPQTLGIETFSANKPNHVRPRGTRTTARPRQRRQPLQLTAMVKASWLSLGLINSISTDVACDLTASGNYN